MATIPLRDYCREIENMIDKGHTEEAIGHCRHVLKHFPKHIDTYRLLGKSYLESRQLGDAADIFQRVLSSVPEDFVSHIGMSIIREDEGNLDAAIWHMERAFEVQSSNIAIQDELKRLYANRDGQEPPKIRLTRGALAHMYAHGHLYAQAIAELRAALTTDPRRLDLQVLLAKMYHADQQQANAAKTASQVLTKLPFSLEANRILADILTQSQRAGEAAPHLARIQELEPYYKHLARPYAAVDQVPSGVIVLEVLDWEATKGGLISQPAWATSIGVDISNSPASEELPEWLSPSSAGGDQSSAAFGNNAFDDHLAGFVTSTQNWESPQLSGDPYQEPAIEPQQNEVPMMQEDDDNIPDWMKSAGWSQRDPNTPEEPPPSLSDDEGEEQEPVGEGEIAKASIPDWLKAMAPSEPADLENDAEAASADLPDWLEGFNAGETAPSRISPPAPTSSPAAPSWLSGETEEAGEAEVELPDWLAEEDNAAEASSLPKADMPDWLQDMGGTPEGIEENTELPDWLSGPESSPAAPNAFNLDELEESTAPEWLQEFGDEAAEDILGTPKAETASSETSWLDQLTQDEEEDPSLHSGVTDWLSTKEQEESGASVIHPASDVPDWLQDLGQELPEEEEIAPMEEAAAAPESLSFEMSDLGKDVDQLAGEDIGLEDDAMAWLESLAAKQGAKEEELLIRPENRQDTAIPSWLEEITDDSAEESIPDESAPEEDVPDWLRGVTEEADLLAEEPVVDFGDTLKIEEEAEEVPSFLEEVTAIETTPEETETPKMEEDEDEAMAWLESLAAKQGAKEEELLTAPTERSEDVPEWLQGILLEDTEETAGEIESPVQETDLADLFDEEEPLAMEEADEFAAFELDMEPSPAAELEEVSEAEPTGEEGIMNEDAALAWLESLAMKHGVNEEELLTDAETRPEETPDWVNAVAEEARAEEAAGLFEPEQAESLDEEVFLEEEFILEDESPEAVPVTEEEDATWLSNLLEDEEDPLFSPTEGVPDWITASTADMLANMSPTDQEETLEEPVSEEAELPDWLQEESVQEEAEPPAWVLEEPAEEPVAEAPEIPDWLREEEPVEETPLPLFQEEPSVAEPVSFPTMETEPEPAPEPETMLEAPVAMEAGETLTQARATLLTGDVVAATEYYENLIKQNHNVDEAITDITEALNTRYPVDIGLWQTLGDAFVKKNKLQDALDAYTKAEELLR